MLAAIAESLAEAGLSVESLTTELQRSTKAGGADFVINADCVTASYLDEDSMHKLVTNLERLKSDLELEVMDIRVQRLASDR